MSPDNSIKAMKVPGACPPGPVPWAAIPVTKWQGAAASPHCVSWSGFPAHTTCPQLLKLSAEMEAGGSECRGAVHGKVS